MFQTVMDRDAAAANRANQSNPNHPSTGPGHAAGYKGNNDKANLDNHGNQLNPNNVRHQQPKK